MGDKLLAFFDKADKIGGLPAKIRLAALAKCPSIKAKSMEDSPENIQKMQQSFDSMSQEFSKKSQIAVEETVKSNDGDTVDKLRGYIKAFSDVLLAQSNNSSLSTAAQQITEVLAESIDVNRASIWLYSEDKSALVCLDLYDRRTKEHTEGVTLYKADFPNYFSTIGNNRTLAAEDVHTHRGTAEFSEVYMKPNGIDAMLDVPIFVQGKMVGVICHEHTDSRRKWNSDEENFAYLMSNVLSKNLEHKR
jgi:transcriptional regulator with GAF, ATPase, and Fis domain